MRIETPLGAMTLVVGDRGIRRLSFDEVDGDDRPGAARVADRLRAYFGGDLAAIDGIAVDPEGTPFQLRVWAALRTIPCGTTWSYADLAARIGLPSAVRAVGAANGRNPVAIVIPCHRVVGARGHLTGYGGGLARKRWLLAHERALLL